MKTPKELERDKQTLASSEKYPVIFSRASGKLRELDVKTNMAGYTLLVQACCIQGILEYEDIDDVYNLLEKVTVIPSIYPVIKNIRPEEQWMKEALRAAGISSGVEEFIIKMSNEIERELKREAKD